MILEEPVAIDYVEGSSFWMGLLVLPEGSGYPMARESPAS
jgi:hypothetical protein